MWFYNCWDLWKKNTVINIYICHGLINTNLRTIKLLSRRFLRGQKPSLIMLNLFIIVHIMLINKRSSLFLYSLAFIQCSSKFSYKALLSHQTDGPILYLIFNIKSAKIRIKSAGVSLKMITILKELRIAQLCS